MTVEVTEIPQSMVIGIRRSLTATIAEFIREAGSSGFDIAFEIRESSSGTPRLEITSHNGGLVLTVEGDAVDE